jgi:hypothetical protein
LCTLSLEEPPLSSLKPRHKNPTPAAIAVPRKKPHRASLLLAKKKRKKPQSFYSLAFLNLYVGARNLHAPPQRQTLKFGKV